MNQNISADTSSIIELRQYALHPGRREELVALFERHFIESQEAAGMRLIGQFRDLENPDRFVWLRGFADMQARGRALPAFYGSATWQTHRAAANATMIDSDDVLLLRPAYPHTGFTLPAVRTPVDEPQQPATLIAATVYLLDQPVDDAFLRFFAAEVRPVLIAAGAAPIACLQSEPAPNNNPALPVRSDAHAFVWLASFADVRHHASSLQWLLQSAQWRERVQPQLAARLMQPAQVLLLEATQRSLLGRACPPGFTLEHTGASSDFDFLEGDWQVLNRRLRLRNASSTEWDEFPATLHARLHLGGVANVDEIVFQTLGWSGMTVRVFDVERRQWSIHWINSRQGKLLPPVFGGFSGDCGEFYGEDEDDGRPVRVRFIWTRRGRDSARWEQAFAYDGGVQWETNWIMELSRR